MRIDIFTCLTGNSAPYAENLRASIEKANSLCILPAEIFFHAIADDTFKDETTWEIHEVVPRKYPNGSANHGQMLNKIINHLPAEAETLIVADVDVAILHPMCLWYLYNWAARLFRAAITPKFSGASSVFFSAFDAKIFREVDPDFMPGTPENGHLTETAMMDTGYKLKEAFPGSYFLEYHDMREDPSGLRYLYTTPLVWLPLVSHLGGSHKKDFESEAVQNWIQACNNKLLSYDHP